MTFVTLNRFCPLNKKLTSPVLNGKYRAREKQSKINKEHTAVFHFISNFQGTP